MNTRARPADADIGLLGLVSVLAGSLPSTLLTDKAPDHYTVEAVFTRRPEPGEIKQIVAEETRAQLAREGYPAVTLTVSDRRLEISHTSLEELRDGLAAVLATLIADVSRQTLRRRDAAVTRFEDAARHEGERAAAVAALAESVSFDVPPAPGGDPGSTEDESEDTETDRTRLSTWDDEGGAA